MMHLAMNGWWYIDDSKGRLAGVCSEVGHWLRWTYDLGDSFEFRITVDAIRAPEDSNGEALVLDGAYGAIPEDFGSDHTRSYPKFVEQYRTGKGKNSSEFREKWNASKNAYNIKGLKKWDPITFSVEECNAAVRQAFASNVSTTSGTQFMYSFGTGETSVQRTENKTPDNENIATCAKCGNPNNLMQCSGCKRVRYCGRECQVSHWKVHKAACKRLDKK
eukprot:TRINITY_DN14558_c0_g1_i1.p1 TRINITY_DN14558_c0_g1~~TRINITY_DN14558_c0_g1_i1.p1  ORF type:complete len:219 (+),score=31.46 TRINITY_DN14558_c0_g1_i1:130-786(+)